MKGNLTKECEVSKTTKGVSVCNFSVATNENYGEQEFTTFIDCTAWRSCADYLGVYGKKGRRVRIDGRLRKNSYVDREGIKRYVTTVDVTDVMIDIASGERSLATAVPVNDIEITEEELPW